MALGQRIGRREDWALFNAQYGYPTEVSIDAREDMEDDGFTLRLTDFVANGDAPPDAGG